METKTLGASLCVVTCVDVDFLRVNNIHAAPQTMSNANTLTTIFPPCALR